MHLLQPGLVELHRVGQDGQDDIVLVQLVVLGELDGAQNVRNARETHQVELADDRFRHALAGQELSPFRFVEQAAQVDHGIVVDGHHHVGVLDIMNPRDVLVADALDAVCTEAVLQQGRALQRFAGHDLAVGEDLLHVIAAGDGPGRTGRGSHAAVVVLRAHQFLEGLFHGVTGDFVVPQVVAELLELVEDHQVLAGLAQLPAFVEDFLHVRLGSGGLDGLTGDFFKPLEAFPAHALRQDGDGSAAQQS